MNFDRALVFLEDDLANASKAAPIDPYRSEAGLRSIGLPLSGAASVLSRRSSVPGT